ncbi:glycosyltransferase family 2 protein [Thalassotalea sp. Y01]|uniref:glycosyltransferase family 2 protein n=1 Tax=Thalassotalea sp. Y01 TaxID=2729613 RepID=UPI00145F1907|nr:glycosyltransferase family 2 protein [Thalassotalea sp. Y01]NMP14980.1 glycosyltransferase family 2 protein [Thalassotalea sp. Y01]
MQNLFKQAATKYQLGDYHGALQLYRQAGAKFGEDLVWHNLSLCQRQIHKNNEGNKESHECCFKTLISDGSTKPALAVLINDIGSLRYLSEFDCLSKLQCTVKFYANTALGLIPVHNMDVAEKYAADFQPVKGNVDLADCDMYASIACEQVLTESDIINFISNKFANNNDKYTQLCDLNVTETKIVDGRVSVIVPTYGRAESLKRALESVASQCYANKEIIVIDDNGLNTDNQLYVAQIVQNVKFNYPELNLRYIPHQYNRNGSAARNTGFLASRGEYLCFLDDDDVYLPGRLTKSVEKLESTSTEIGAVYCGYINGNESGRNKKRYIAGNLSEEILLLDYQKHYIHTNTVTYKRAAVAHLNGFDESYIRHQDLEFNLRFFQSFKTDVVTEPLVHIRPLQVTHENKVYDEAMMAIKHKFLSQFASLIASYGEKVQRKIYLHHWNELIEFSSSKKLLKKKLKHNNHQFDLNLFK